MKKIIALLLATVFVLCGCGGQSADEPPVNVDVAELYTKLEAVGMPEMVDINADMMLSLYGIEQADVKQAKVTVCSDGLRADEVWLIEAVDADAAARLKTLAQNRLSQKDAESVTYSPEQNAIVKKALLQVEGNYLFFITSPDVDRMTGVVNDALGK